MSEHGRTHPTLGAGKICYLEIPASDVQGSAAFYEKVFGWSLRHRGDGAIAFDDGVNEVSGTWVLDRPPMQAPGLLVYVMVANVAETADEIVRHGGEIVQPIGADALRDSAIRVEMFLEYLSNGMMAFPNKPAGRAKLYRLLEEAQLSRQAPACHSIHPP